MSDDLPLADWGAPYEDPRNPGFEFDPDPTGDMHWSWADYSRAAKHFEHLLKEHAMPTDSMADYLQHLYNVTEGEGMDDPTMKDRFDRFVEGVRTNEEAAWDVAGRWSTIPGEDGAIVKIRTDPAYGPGAVQLAGVRLTRWQRIRNWRALR
jgi:hypothetical protein